MKIIALSGKRGAGKTVLANYLVKKHGYVKVSFAEELRRISRMLMPFTESDLDNPAKKEAKFLDYDWSPREFMIHLGEFMRFHDSDYWVNVAFTRLSNEKAKYVFDDLRFPNEAKILKDYGALLVRIDRFESKNPYGKNLDIESEKALDNHKFDYTVTAQHNGTLEELYNHAKPILELV